MKTIFSLWLTLLVGFVLLFNPPQSKAWLAQKVSSGGTSCGPLDTVPSDTVAFAYGLQKLRNAYAGNAFTLIRSSDSTTQAFGFVGCDVDTSSISTFCSATTCKMTVYDDQGVNGNNCTFASGNRPTITLAVYNGHPKLQFTNSDPDFCTGTLASGVTAATIVTIGTLNTGGTSFPTMFSSDPSGNGLILNSTIATPDIEASRFVGGTQYTGTKTITADALHQFTGTFNNTLSRVFLDNVAGTDNTTSATLASTTDVEVGEASVCGSGCYLIGDLEVIIEFAPDISTTDVGTVYNNLKTYWGTP